MEWIRNYLVLDRYAWIILQTFIETIIEKKILLITLILISSVNLIANHLGQNIAVLVGNLVYVPLVTSLLIISSVMMFKSGFVGKHGLAWIVLVWCSASWFIAELTWIFYELVLETDPFPSLADVFYILGYVFFFMFLLLYIEPVQKAITKKMILFASLISLSVLIPSLLVSSYSESEIPFFAAILAGAYPVADSLIIIPSLIGIVLFFRGKVNFMWTLVCLGILSMFIADIVFLFAQLDEWYYTGHPLEILFYFAYVLIAFGVYYNMKVFSIPWCKAQKRFTKRTEFDMANSYYLY